MNWVLVLGVVVTLLLIALIVHLVLNWFDRRGWVYYRNPDRPPPKSLGILDEIYQPSVTHVIEEETRQATEADQAESGDPEAPDSA